MDTQIRKWFDWSSQIENEKLKHYQFGFNKQGKKEFMAASIKNWNWVEDLCLMLQVEPLSTKFCICKNCHFICYGWERLFKIQEPIFKELSVEFFSTTIFKFNGDVNDKGAHNFRLKGKDHECSTIELSWRSGIYDRLDAIILTFTTFLNESFVSLPKELFVQDLWFCLANGTYNKDGTLANLINSPAHRFIHIIITFSINQRESWDRVQERDLYFLEYLLFLISYFRSQTLVVNWKDQEILRE